MIVAAVSSEVLFVIALRMVFPEIGGSHGPEAEEEDPFIVPLAVLMIAGPSAVAAILFLVSRDPERFWTGGRP